MLPIKINLVINLIMFLLIFIYMQIESSNNSKAKGFPQASKVEKENIICKDGFCKLPNQNENSNIIENNVNLFDPI